jgi:hypothetical protein
VDDQDVTLGSPPSGGNSFFGDQCPPPERRHRGQPSDPAVSPRVHPLKESSDVRRTQASRTHRRLQKTREGVQVLDLAQGVQDPLQPTRLPRIAGTQTHRFHRKPEAFQSHPPSMPGVGPHLSEAGSPTKRPVDESADPPAGRRKGSERRGKGDERLHPPRDVPTEPTRRRTAPVPDTPGQHRFLSPKPLMDLPGDGLEPFGNSSQES